MATTQPAAVDRPATIHDIAALCGVAASTVSRALSTPDRVNIRTRQRIEAAAAQLHYTPNSQAKALSSGRTGAVGVLVPDITNPFYFDLIRGTQLQLKAAGYTQLLVDTEESDEVEASTVEQLRKSADGIIVAASRLSDEALLDAAAKMPMVAINRDVPGVPARPDRHPVRHQPGAGPPDLAGAHPGGLCGRPDDVAVQRTAVDRAVRGSRGARRGGAPARSVRPQDTVRRGSRGRRRPQRGHRLHRVQRPHRHRHAPAPSRTRHPRARRT